jgi:hypothetical protein
MQTVKYSMGEKYSKWTMLVTIYQSLDGYKYIITDPEDEGYLGTNYLTAKTSNEIDEIISNIVSDAERLESINDVFILLQNTFYGSLFYERLKISPQLTDGVILLATEGG